jgi:ribosome-associated protein
MPDQDVQLRGEWIALNDLLKIAGISDSGGSAKALVASGAVRVDGIVELRKTKKIRAGQRVEVAGVRIRLQGSS